MGIPRALTLALVMLAGPVQAQSAPSATNVSSPSVPVVPACSQLRPGTNTVKVATQNRRIDLFIPAKPTGAPVLFIWHGLRDKPANMARWFGAQAMATQHGAIVVVPHSSGEFPNSEWGFTGGRPQVDSAFFDQTLACLGQEFKVDLKRVYTTGFSAGALWSTWLVMHRSHRIAAAALFSGGVGGILDYTTPTYDVPVLAVHGGPSDVFGSYLDFSQMTMELVRSLVTDGHKVIYCDHGRGHRIPFRPSRFAVPFLFKQAWGHPVKGGPPAGHWPAFCQRG